MTRSAGNRFGVLESGRRRTRRWVGAVWLLTVFVLAGGWYAERHEALQSVGAWHSQHSSF
jgi:hypothetical protein